AVSPFRRHLRSSPSFSFTLLFPRPPAYTLFPYTTLFRSRLRSPAALRRAEPAEQTSRTVSIAATRASSAGSSSTEGQSVRWTERDRKSTRLNSSHVKNSYAVFCL